MYTLRPNSNLNRRAFLRLVTSLGGATALSIFLQACAKDVSLNPTQILVSTPTETPNPTASAEPTTTPTTQPSATPQDVPSPTASPTAAGARGTARLAFVKTSDRAEGVRRAIELLGMEPLAGKHVLLKPNLNSADPTPGSTHPDVLRALVQQLQTMGAGPIMVGDRSGMGDTRRVMEQTGVFALAGELGFETLVFDELDTEGWKLFRLPDSHWAGGFPMARPCLECEVIVQTCCLKTHRYGGHFTLSLKNSVGMVAKRRPQDPHDYMQELHQSPHQRRMIAEINAAYTPALVVLDGVEAFISGGPDQGQQVHSEVILAGVDRVALDAAGVALLRYHGCQTEAAQGQIFEQEQIARAVELGLGVDSPEKIELVTADEDSAAYAQAIQELLLNS